MEINDFLAIGIVGAVTSLAIDSIKARWGTESWVTKLVTIGMSIFIGVGYVWARQTSYFETILVILGSASLVYSFFLKK